MKLVIVLVHLAVGAVVLLLFLSWAIAGGSAKLLILAFGLLLALLLLNLARGTSTEARIGSRQRASLFDAKSTAHLSLTLGVAAYVFAIYLVLSPHDGPFSGRWSSLLNFLQSKIGWLTLPVVLFTAGTILITSGFAVMKKVR